ncbi:MAG: hypothetical protein UU23_C0001G0100 [Candidatus Curtissbacteria bacterium GW2011_GWA1_40_9]|uniref:LytR/CpsA/Psr regulator C-terminal domain-containing protein n=1 Tax=Candidatus Curtissbacteria bacterium GW2011_GWA1_40_9 TaxID=1618408 RepID=A0A0G0TU29_9BACT|nr:MAG: hypothetical protein UU23_C0001G0100 [Candidatus Curtissbacteria bacterium GW2011_GWA1_40_9]
MFSNPKVLLISKDNIQLYQDPENPIQLDFTPDSVKHLEIINIDSFRQNLKQFFQRNNLSTNKIIIVLSDNILFEKEISSREINTQKTQTQNFVDEVPIEPEKRGTFTISQQNKELTIITNKQLYEVIIDILARQNVAVTHVVPSIFYLPKIYGPLGKQIIKKITQDNNILNKIDFLSQSEAQNSQHDGETQRDQKTAQPDNNQTAKAVIGIVLVGVSVALSLYAFGIVNNPFNKSDNTKQQPTQKNNTPTQAVDRVENTNQPVPKETLSVQIISAGTRDQTAKVNTILETLGFNNIAIGSLSITGSDKTIVNYSASVSSEIKSELQNELEKIFIEVITTDKTIDPNYDISIVIGKERL